MSKNVASVNIYSCQHFIMQQKKLSHPHWLRQPFAYNPILIYYCAGAGSVTLLQSTPSFAATSFEMSDTVASSA